MANAGPAREIHESGVPEQQSAAPSSSASWYHSARIQGMMEKKKRGKFRTQVEAEIAASEVTWSEVDARMCQPEQSGTTNRESFEMLRGRKYVRLGDQLVFQQVPDNERRHVSLFDDLWGLWDDGLVVGEKLAEGGQAEIYAATHLWSGTPMVAKVFKGGSVLQHLEKQISPALLHYYQDSWKKNPDGLPLPGDGLVAATLLKDETLMPRTRSFFKRFFLPNKKKKDERFAFVMRRAWGDLRKLLDQHMLQNKNQGPPFPLKDVLHLMWSIANDMKNLHGQRPPILHNDLKAANVLVNGNKLGPYLNEDGTCRVYVADYECSVGVLGTNFWRAPEILEQLKDRVNNSPLTSTDKCDVYSYGMTCYELVTGCIPFEDYIEHRFGEGRDLVLNGNRPELPKDLHPIVNEIITSCWHSTPSERPSFKDIVETLDIVIPSLV